jgi:hypothetical protein
MLLLWLYIELMTFKLYPWSCLMASRAAAAGDDADADDDHNADDKALPLGLHSNVRLESTPCSLTLHKVLICCKLTGLVAFCLLQALHQRSGRWRCLCY